MSKEKRRFKRYQVRTEFNVIFNGLSYGAETYDYSVDGLSAFVSGSPPIKAGDTVQLDVPGLRIKTPGKVVRVGRQGHGLSLGIQRVGFLHGSIADFSVADLLLGLQRSGKTGILLIKSKKVQKSVQFYNGDIVFASSNMREDWLGEMLLRERRITREQFDESSRMMESAGKRHGTVLVEMGILKPADLFDAVIRSVENIILSLFKMYMGEFLFKESPLPADESIKLRLSAANLIYKGLRELDDVEFVRKDSPHGDKVLCFSTDPLDLFQDLRLSPSDKALFKMVDGRKTYRELIQSASGDKFDVMRAFNALLATRVIEVQDDIFAKRAEADEGAQDDLQGGHPEEVKAEDVFGSDEPEAPSTEDIIKEIDQMYREYKTLGYYGVLEVFKGASVSDIKKAYYKKAKEYHPDRHYGLPSEMKDKLSVIFTYITQAYTTLSDSVRRSEYERRGNEDSADTNVTDPIKRAVVKFEEATVLFKKARYEQAALVFAEAAYMDSGNAKYHYFAARALMGAGKHKESERTLQRALKIDPFNADYIAESGHVYLALGFFKRARSSFEKAVKMQPLHRRALEGIDKLPADE